MSVEFKVLHYVNQFFGQVGGEDKAGIVPEFHQKKVGPAIGLEKHLKGEGKVIGTLICGDNYFNENKEKALSFILDVIKKESPDIFVAGPAFNAGRYGIACAEISKAVTEQLEIPVVTGMYIENPGLDTCKDIAYVVSTGTFAAGMKEALPLMANIACKLAKGVELGSPEEEGYIPRGMRKTLLVGKRGSLRAVEMLIKRLKGQEFETEMPMPVFDVVDPAAAIKDLKKATIALVTSGGIVPAGNPDRVQSASAQKWAKYDVSDRSALNSPDFYTTHGGYDPVYANEIPDRVAPLDILKELEKEEHIDTVYDYFYTTTGTGTSVGNAVKFGTEIGKELKEAGVDGVILTST